ncbi:MAG TPA: GAF domain-containing protein [Solirubrobacteraceae bacterium]|jgi:signal transduction histidine kinase|nr:GAF domain-containing protein [Solirubrobacteraceae bacterium]
MDRAVRGVLDLARDVLAELDLDVVLERVLDSAQELTGARYAALGVLDESRSELSQFITRGIDPATHAAIGALPRGRGVLGALIEDPVPLRLGDVGRHPRSYGFPRGHPPMRTFLGAPIVVRGLPYGNLYLTEKAGGAQFSAEDEEALTVLAELAGVAIDHARRYTGASERRDELERTVATLDATTQIALAVGGETDLDVILELVAKRGRALVGARVLLIELRHRQELVVAAGAGELPAGVVGQTVQLRDSLAGQALRARRTLRLDDEVNRARFEEHGTSRLGVSARGGLVVPLLFRGHGYGALLALDRLEDGPSFSAEDERLLVAFAASAATAVATAQSVATERHRQRLAAAEGERRRWARELHDDTLQSLSALRIGLSTAARSTRPEALRDAFLQGIEQLEEAITNLRALITDLRPAALDELGTQAAVEALAERAARHGIEIDVSIDLARERGGQVEGDGALARHTPELETAIYRIVQEALTNATKHGGAKRAVVEIHEEGDTVRIEVRDDGAGFDPAADTTGFGLLGMRERIELLDGTLRIDSSPGAGATVRASFPVQRRAGAAPAAVREIRGG